MNRAKKMYLALVFLLIFGSTAFADNNTDILKVARSQIGCGETIANNHGKDVEKYLRNTERWPWCAGFVSYCLKEAGLNKKYTLRAKNFLTYGKEVETPIPGDIVVFTRKGGGHVGIVEEVKEDCYITIEGNVGAYPAKVKRITHKYNEKNFMAFIRVI